MTREELIEHKRLLRQKYNTVYYNKKKQKHNDIVNDNGNDDVNVNDDGLYNLLYGLYELLNGLNELCSISQDDTIDDRIEETEDSIIELEEQLNIPLEDRLLYHLYNGDDEDDDEDDED